MVASRTNLRTRWLGDNSCRPGQNGDCKDQTLNSTSRANKRSCPTRTRRDGRSDAAAERGSRPTRAKNGEHDREQLGQQRRSAVFHLQDGPLRVRGRARRRHVRHGPRRHALHHVRTRPSATRLRRKRVQPGAFRSAVRRRTAKAEPWRASVPCQFRLPFRIIPRTERRGRSPPRRESERCTSLA